MGFLSDLGLDDVDSDPNALPDGTYKAALFECKIIEAKDAAKGKFVVFTYKVTDPDSKYQGTTIDEWKSANSFDEPRKKAWLKQRIMSLGVPEARVNAVDPSDLLGTAVDVTVKQKGEYRNVTFVKLSDESSAAAEPVSAGSIADLL